MKWTTEEIDFLKENYTITGVEECSIKLNRTHNSIIRKANRLNLKVDKNITNSIKSKKAKILWDNRYEKIINNNFIKKIKTDIYNIDEKFAYVLGYLWGDGYLHHQGKNGLNFISLEIDKKDGEEIKNIMCEIANWKIYYRNRKNKQSQMNFFLGNKKFVEYLLSLNFDKKSYIKHSIIKKIPKKNRKYFYLGLSDADGNFYINKKQYTYQYSISSSYEQDWIYIEKLLKELDIKYKINRIENKKDDGNYHKSSNIRITNKKDVIKIGNYLYSGENKGLKRKYEIYKQIIK